MARGYVYMLYDIQNGETLCEHVKSYLLQKLFFFFFNYFFYSLILFHRNPYYQEFTVRTVYNRTLTKYTYFISTVKIVINIDGLINTDYIDILIKTYLIVKLIMQTNQSYSFQEVEELIKM